MMKLVQNLVFFLRRQVIILGLYRLGLWFSGGKNELNILCYHSFSNENVYSVPIEKVEKQIESLRKVADFVSLEAVFDIFEGEKPSKPQFVLTIDDGYKDALKLLPISQKYSIPVTIFILANPEDANRKELDSRNEFLSWEDVSRLKKAGWKIGCHTSTHPNFNNLTKEELKKEILDAKKIIEAKTGGGVDYFAYPKGVYNPEILSMVKEAGFKMGLSILPGSVVATSNRWVLPRTVVNQYDEIAENPALYTKGPWLLGKIIEGVNRV